MPQLATDALNEFEVSTGYRVNHQPGCGHRAAGRLGNNVLAECEVKRPKCGAEKSLVNPCKSSLVSAFHTSYHTTFCLCLV